MFSMEMTLYAYLFRGTRKITSVLVLGISQLIGKGILLGNGVKYHSSLLLYGIPEVNVHRTASFKIGKFCKINSALYANPIGRYSPAMFMVREHAVLSIGNSVGISSAAFICHQSIIIEDSVKIGGGVCIYDTDFHSLNVKDRSNSIIDINNKKTAAVLIKKNVFIGAHSTVLKGVTIGENTIIGACSLVSKSVPSNEIWAGNPAKFIRKIDDFE